MGNTIPSRARDPRTRLRHRLARRLVGAGRADSGLRQRARAARGRNRTVAQHSGDPEATGAAILEIVDAEKPPLRVFFGIVPLTMIKPEYEKRLAT